MAKQSLEHSLSSLNLSLDSDSYDALTDCLAKAHALAHVALAEHFVCCDYSIVHDYLSVLEDLILQAKQQLETLWKNRKEAKRVDVE